MTILTASERSSHSVDGTPDEPERFDVVVIGGGQAGLAAGYHLARHGFRFVILDAHPRIGDPWRNRWNSLELFTPARFSGLPGKRFPAPPNHYPTKNQMADYLEAYATEMGLPVRSGTAARRVTRDTSGGWIVETSGPALRSESVVIATGAYQHPVTPAFAADLDDGIVQLHSAEYRSPAQLQPGGVLVVGASTSGAEIAVEASREHETILAGRDTGHMPIQPGRGIGKIASPAVWFAMSRILTVDTPMGRKFKTMIRTHGAPLDPSRRRALTASGVRRVTQRVNGTLDGKPMLADGAVLDVRNVVWCTGFHGDYSWIEGVRYGDDGYPVQRRGVVSEAPGLYFVGLKFQHAAASSLVGGVGRDAKGVTDHIASRVRQAA